MNTEEIKQGIDEVAVSVEAVQNVKMKREHIIVTAGVALVSLAVGAAASYVVTKKVLKTKYEALLEEELEEAASFCDMRVEKERRDIAKMFEPDPPNPKDIVVSPKSPTIKVQTETPKDSAATNRSDSPELVQYDKMAGKYSQKSEPDPTVEVKVTVDTNGAENAELVVEVDEETGDVFDYAEEMLKRKKDPYAPYICSRDEFFENADEHEQSDLTYFEKDDTLVDSTGKEVLNRDVLVGENNLDRFGHGSGDPNILYIRNKNLDIDFEITKDKGSYASSYLGFEEYEDEGPKVRKFRDSYDN